LLMLVQFMMGRDADQLLRWMMGRIPPESPPALIIAGSLTALIGLAISLRWSRALDAAALSDDEATSVGVNLPALRIGMFLTAGVLTAVSVLLAGPIGFVGLIAPHLARMVVGSRHAALLISAAIIGASLLLAADAAVQLIPHLPGIRQPRGLLPIGILTSAIGGPMFIYLLRNRSSGWIQ
jgi:iron complex transport system permease protein